MYIIYYRMPLRRRKRGGSTDTDIFEYDAGLIEDSFERLTAKKPSSSFSKDTNNAIVLLSLDTNDVVPFGSWTYKSQLYPGDVDLVEVSAKCCTREESLNFFEKGLKKIVKNIQKTRGAYVGDIKAGIDYLFKFDIGKLLYDTRGNFRIEGYYPDKILIVLNELYAQELISQEDYDDIIDLVVPTPNALDYENLYDMLRDKWLLRWSAKEIEQGYKMLSGGRKKTLYEAIQEPTMTKIDMWYNIDGRYLEVTNVYALYTKDKDGNEELLNFSNDVINMARDLKKEVEKYAFSPKYYKPFKLVKRMWSIARMTGDRHIVELLTPLMQSDLGRMNQIGSEAETLVSILEKVKSPPFAAILRQIESFLPRLANVYEVEWDEEAIDKQIKEIISHGKNKKKDKEYMIGALTKLKKYFTELINENTVKYLESVGLMPVPSEYLPEEISGGDCIYCDGPKCDGGCATCGGILINKFRRGY